jgi:putative endonuclease
MLRCSDGSFYTGYTNDLAARVACHNAGLASKCTRARLPVKLIWSKKCSGKIQAMKLEYKIKQLSRKEKETLLEKRKIDH